MTSADFDKLLISFGEWLRTQRVDILYGSPTTEQLLDRYKNEVTFPLIIPEPLNFESEGFKYKKEYLPGLVYEKPYENHPGGYTNKMIEAYCHHETNWVVISNGDSETMFEDWDTMFVGIIPTQNDLKKVLTMIITH